MAASQGNAFYLLISFIHRGIDSACDRPLCNSLKYDEFQFAQTWAHFPPICVEIGALVHIFFISHFSWLRSYPKGILIHTFLYCLRSVGDIPDSVQRSLYSLEIPCIPVIRGVESGEGPTPHIEVPCADLRPEFLNFFHTDCAGEIRWKSMENGLIHLKLQFFHYSNSYPYDLWSIFQIFEAIQ